MNISRKTSETSCGFSLQYVFERLARHYLLYSSGILDWKFENLSNCETVWCWSVLPRSLRNIALQFQLSALHMKITEIQYENCTPFFFLLEYDCAPTIIFGSLFQNVSKSILYLDSLPLINYSEDSSSIIAYHLS
jgi:hypothetical protein